MVLQSRSGAGTRCPFPWHQGYGGDYPSADYCRAGQWLHVVRSIHLHLQQLYLLYSFKPYHLLRADRWPELDFATTLNQDLQLPLAKDGMPIRNSVNPVDYDAEHFLHVVHKVYPGKQYAFWAVLIGKETLLPRFISDRPLVCGWRSAPASIIYVCALVPRECEILVFGGLNDSSIGIWRVPRTRLHEHWKPL